MPGSFSIARRRIARLKTLEGRRLTRTLQLTRASVAALLRTTPLNGSRWTGRVLPVAPHACAFSHISTPLGLQPNQRKRVAPFAVQGCMAARRRGSEALRSPARLTAEEPPRQGSSRSLELLQRNFNRVVQVAALQGLDAHLVNVEQDTDACSAPLRCWHWTGS
jgi:hypothetical protein